MPYPDPAAIVARELPYDVTMIGLVDVPELPLVNWRVPVNVVPPSKKILSPAEYVPRFTRAIVFQGCETEPADLSLPVELT